MRRLLTLRDRQRDLTMDYINALRKHIGHDPIILVGAATFIFDKDQRLLLLKRSDNGCWGIPGGAMELGESLEDTARRETKEETQLDVGEMTLFNVFSGADMYYQYPNGDQVYNVTAVYITDDAKGSIKVDGNEHTTCQYFDLPEIPEPISPPIRKILKLFIDQIGEEQNQNNAG